MSVTSPRALRFESLPVPIYLAITTGEYFCRLPSHFCTCIRVGLHASPLLSDLRDSPRNHHHSIQYSLPNLTSLAQLCFLSFQSNQLTQTTIMVEGLVNRIPLLPVESLFVPLIKSSHERPTGAHHNTSAFSRQDLPVSHHPSLISRSVLVFIHMHQDGHAMRKGSVKAIQSEFQEPLGLRRNLTNHESFTAILYLIQSSGKEKTR